MNPVHLQSFLTILEEGSFRAAAKKLGIKQPSLSQQIAKLEDSVDDLLLERTGAGVVPTPAGRILAERAGQILELIEDTQRAIHEDIDAGRGLVTVGVIPSLAPYLLPRAVRAFRDEFANTEIRVTEAPTDELLAKLAKGAIDFGIIATEEKDPSLTVERLYDELLLLAMPADSDCVDKPRLCAPDLEAAGVIVLGDVHCLAEQVEDFCRRDGVERFIRVDSGQITTLVELVRSGVGITMLPELAIQSHDMTGIVTRRPVNGAPTRPIGIAWSKGRQRNPLAKALAAQLAETARALTAPQEKTPAANA